METLNKNKDFQVHPDDVDVRGWDVVAKGNHLGVVNDLILDISNKRIKYLDVMNKNNKDDENYHYLIPLDQVKFNRINKNVNLEVDSHQFQNTYPRFSDNEIPDNYEDKVRIYYLENDKRKHPDDQSRRYDKEEIYKNKSTPREVEGLRESPYGSEYERIKNNPENWKGKIDALERQKQLKKIELERDIALIDVEINKLKARNQ
jgi:sporulation protein YlmC with PRC-barrel domain